MREWSGNRELNLRRWSARELTKKSLCLIPLSRAKSKVRPSTRCLTSQASRRQRSFTTSRFPTDGLGNQKCLYPTSLIQRNWLKAMNVRQESTQPKSWSECQKTSSRRKIMIGSRWRTWGRFRILLFSPSLPSHNRLTAISKEFRAQFTRQLASLKSWSGRIEQRKWNFWRLKMLTMRTPGLLEKSTSNASLNGSCKWKNSRTA